MYQVLHGINLIYKLKTTKEVYLVNVHRIQSHTLDPKGWVRARRLRQVDESVEL